MKQKQEAIQGSYAGALTEKQREVLGAKAAQVGKERSTWLAKEKDFKAAGLWKKKTRKKTPKPKPASKPKPAPKISLSEDALFKDKDGNPIEFYHGSSQKFDKFDLRKLRTGADAGGESWYGDGVYLSGEPWKGSMYSYANPDKGYVAKVAVDVKRPFVTKANEWFKSLEKAGIDPGASSDVITRELKQQGYDSIAVLKITKEGSKNSRTINELVVFNSDDAQIGSWASREAFDTAKEKAAFLPEPPPAPAPSVPSPPEEMVKRVLADEERQDTIKTVARLHKMEPDEVVESVNRNLKKTVDDSYVVMRTDYRSMEAISKEGSFKNQFQVGKSNAVFDKETRVAVERDLMGVAEDAKDEARPIYASMSADKDGGGFDGPAHFFGEVVVRFKDDVKKKSTFMADDTMLTWGRSGLAKRRDAVPKSVCRATSEVDHTSLRGGRMRPWEQLVDGKTRPEDIFDGYCEVQVHGGATLDDVEEVLLPTKSNNPHAEKYLESIRKNLTEKGVKVGSYSR